MEKLPEMQDSSRTVRLDTVMSAVSNFDELTDRGTLILELGGILSLGRAGFKI